MSVRALASQALVAVVAVVACGGVQRTAGYNPTVEYRGLWFADHGCATQFAMPRVIRETEMAAFARCLESLDLRPSRRRHPLVDGAVFTYGGGLEVTARYDVTPRERRLMSIGFSGGRRPTIAPATLESLRTAGSWAATLTDDQKTAVLATVVAPRTYAFVRMRVCLDDTGAITSVVPLESSTPELVGLLDDVSDWRFRPFIWNGAPRGVCALVERVYPPSATRGADRAALVTEEMPFPAVAPPVILRGAVRPIGGDDYPHSTLAVAVRYCIDESGRTSSVHVVERSGVRRFDEAARRMVATWRFGPFLVHGRPTRVCSVAVFGRSVRTPSRVRRHMAPLR